MSYPKDCPAHGGDGCTKGECPDYMAVWLRGACSSGDPLRRALVLVLDEFQRRPVAADDPGIRDRIVAEVKKVWPRHAELHRFEPFAVEPAIELAVHIALSMVQRGGSPTPMDPRDMHGLAIGEGVDAGNWYTYCPACSWDAGEQVGKCLEPVVAAQWPDASAFVPRSTS